MSAIQINPEKLKSCVKLLRKVAANLDNEQDALKVMAGNDVHALWKSRLAQRYADAVMATSKEMGNISEHARDRAAKLQSVITKVEQSESSFSGGGSGGSGGGAF